MDEAYIPVVKEPEPQAVPVDRDSGPVKVLSTVVPLYDREFRAQCSSCTAQLSFKAQHVFSTYKTWTAWLMAKPDEFGVRCPNCMSAVSVRGCLPEWLQKRIG